MCKHKGISSNCWSLCGSKVHSWLEIVRAANESIALSAKFGPHYEGGIKFVEDQLAKQGDDLTAFRATVARITGAKDPDHLDSRKPS